MWECESCKERTSSPHLNEGACGYCEGPLRLRLSPEEFAEIAEGISERIAHVGEVLDYDVDSYDISNGEVEVHYSRPACSSGCCGWESGSETFPLSYLFLSDEELKKTEEGRKLDEERQRKERESATRQKRELEEARRRLQQAEAKARTAEQDAAKELKEAQRKLQSLEGQAS